jgi:hypothetical protein
MGDKTTKGTTAFTLSDSDKRRLLYLAPLFGIQAIQLPGNRVRICMEGAGSIGVPLELPEATAYYRLLLEVSSRAARWLFFHHGEHCGKTLLSLTDAKIERVAVLYRTWRSLGATE